MALLEIICNIAYSRIRIDRMCLWEKQTISRRQVQLSHHRSSWSTSKRIDYECRQLFYYVAALAHFVDEWRDRYSNWPLAEATGRLEALEVKLWRVQRDCRFTETWVLRAGAIRNKSEDQYSRTAIQVSAKKTLPNDGLITFVVACEVFHVRADIARTTYCW